MTGTPRADARAKLEKLADLIAIATAVVLPWSISATGICVVLWLLATIPTIDAATFRRIFARPAAWLPVALFGFAAIAMLWSPVPFKEQWRAADDFLKLALIPLLFIHFQRSERGHWVFAGFLFSGVVLLLGSALVVMIPELSFMGMPKTHGVLVKDYISQSAVFTLCAFGLLYLGLDAFRLRRFHYGALFLALAILFLANLFFVVASRTALLSIPLLLLLLAFKNAGWRGAAVVCAAGLVLAVAIWTSSHNVRYRLGGLFEEVRTHFSEPSRTSAGERIEFWKRSIRIMSGAALVGHGTGSTREMFLRTAQGHSGLDALVTGNPHNQTFAVGIQLGLIGVALLYAMWLSHALLFRGAGFAAWIGLLVVAQNFLGSLANSHLFDATHAWIYILGVGVAGGMAMKRSAVPAPLPSARAA